ncbi:MAG: class I SAM-dependent methyltransferase [Phycisphaerae bacterium]|nr:class I SAM-dependent methyltransferase [Phycisphaerae bacterium]
MTQRDLQSHWQRVYLDKAPTAVSWYQAVPTRSLALIDAAAPSTVVDVGGGASTLVDHLIARPGVQVCVVDIAAAALELDRARLGAHASARVRWIEADATGPLAQLADAWADVWHDRAVFHFLATPEQRLAYARNVARVLKPGGTAIVAAFAPDGPEKCSGLPVCRHDAASIAAELSRSGRAFAVAQSQREEHVTPWGAVQAFEYAVLRDR